MKALDSSKPFHEIFEQCQKSSKAHSSPDVIATNNKYTDLILIFQSNGVFVDHFCNVRTHFQTGFGIEKHRKPGNHFLKSKKMSYDITEMIYKVVTIVKKYAAKSSQNCGVIRKEKNSQCFGNVQILNEKDKVD